MYNTHSPHHTEQLTFNCVRCRQVILKTPETIEYHKSRCEIFYKSENRKLIEKRSRIRCQKDFKKKLRQLKLE